MAAFTVGENHRHTYSPPNHREDGAHRVYYGFWLLPNFSMWIVPGTLDVNA